MTPQQQWDYKQRWIPLALQESHIHPDRLLEVKQWLKQNVPLHQWHIRLWSGPEEHTVWFELREHQQQLHNYLYE